MRSPFSPLQLFVFVFILSFLAVVVQIGVLTIAFDKLGLSASSAFLLLFASLFGSAVNLPLFTINAERPLEEFPVSPLRGLLRLPVREFAGKTLVAVNVGGCLIPIFFSVYLLSHNPLPGWQVLSAIAGVTLICRLFSRPIPGLGIGMPIFIAPLAYISGTLGVLIGADLMRINDIRRLGTPFASIGGAGTFDGIFITGVVAALLA